MIRTAAVAAVAALLATGLGAVPPAAATEPASCAAQRTPASFRACMATATRVYVDQWTTALSARGVTSTPPSVRIFAAAPANACVDPTLGDVAVASFWCDKDATIYFSAFAAPFWTRTYAREARRAGVLASDAARLGRTEQRLLRGHANQGAATELAHELGHWVQEQAGLADWYERRMAPQTARAGRYQSAYELASDCMAGWVQGRAAAAGAWRDTAFIDWASHATIAELGADMTGMRPGFRFPRDVPLIGHGGPFSRLRLYDAGVALGRSGADGVGGCARAAATFTRTTAPPGT